MLLRVKELKRFLRTVEDSDLVGLEFDGRYTLFTTNDWATARPGDGPVFLLVVPVGQSNRIIDRTLAEREAK